MPIAPTYPGVYIEEVPSGVRTIVGVGTSTAAFVGFTQRGPTNEGWRWLAGRSVLPAETGGWDGRLRLEGCSQARAGVPGDLAIGSAQAAAVRRGRSS